MLKYITTAVALKAFSSNALMRSQYRKLGNSLGGKRRQTESMPGYYPERVKRMLRLQREHNIVQDGDRILELGTGWLHWEALTLRLFVEIEAVLFDVWDNRQLAGVKNYLRQLGPMLSDGFGLSPGEIRRAESTIDSVLHVKSFDDLYELLGFEYCVQSSGDLSRFPDNSFQLVVSAGVLEHVKREAATILISETQRVLESGGWASHSIDTSDHLAHYDKGVSRKMYLTFSESAWHRLFENEVQYINRMQRGEWLRIFKANGFELIEEESQQTDTSTLKLADKYSRMPKMDLECTVLRVLLKEGIGEEVLPRAHNAAVPVEN